MSTKHIDMGHHFLSYIVEEKYMNIKYISSKENLADIMTNTCYEDNHTKHVKGITEG